MFIMSEVVEKKEKQPRDQVIGVYALYVRYDDGLESEIGLYKVDDPEKKYTKMKLELVDSFTSAFSSKQELLDYVEKRSKLPKKPVDIYIKYKHSQKELINGVMTSNNRVKKHQVIINDPFIKEVSRKYVNNKYVLMQEKPDVNSDIKEYDNFMKAITNMAKKLGTSRLEDDSYLTGLLQHLQKKLIKYVEACETNSDKRANIYNEIYNEINGSYSVFRKIYFYLKRYVEVVLGRNMNDVLYELSPVEIARLQIEEEKRIRAQKRQEMQKLEEERIQRAREKEYLDYVANNIEKYVSRYEMNEYKKYKERQNQKELEEHREQEENLYLQIQADNIMNETLKNEFMLANGNMEEIFITLGKNFCDNLSESDKAVVFGDYEGFLEEIRIPYPELFRKRN